MAFLDKAYILSSVRSLLNEYSSVKWTDEQINSWINEAAIDISTKTLAYDATQRICASININRLEHDEPPAYFLKKEDGAYLLLESGGKISLAYAATQRICASINRLEHDEPPDCIKVHACLSKTAYFLKKEDGAYLLLESGGKIFI